ncbi:hypothetical protein ACLKA6_007853 [Drosophila palustris]
MDTEVKDPAETPVLLDGSSGKNPDLQDNQIDPKAGGLEITSDVGSTEAVELNELQGDPSKGTLRHLSLFGDNSDVEATNAEEDVEQLVSKKLELNEEARESKKERLKKQRSLRFTIGELHESPQNVNFLDPVDAELQDMIEVGDSAISTPYISEDSEEAFSLRIQRSNASTGTAVEIDTGRFVDPLTGEDIPILAAQTKTKNSYLLASVSMDLSYVDNIVMTTEQHLESLILSVLGNKSEYLRRITERELKLMRKKRDEISDARLNLITRKHTLGKIREKIGRLEKINEDICMEDFISIQNQVSALNKKIEERNIELKRLRVNYHSELHMTHHNREKSIAIACKLEEHNLQLQKTIEAQRVLRERLYKAKMERSRIRKQHSDLTFQGGILTMPALMHDFDDTVEKVKTKQVTINEMKETVVRLTQRISALETRCL